MNSSVMAFLILVTDGYARQPSFDVESYTIDLDVDVDRESLTCSSTIELTVTDRTVRELRLDYSGPPLEELLVDRHPPAAYDTRENRLIIPLTPADTGDGRLSIASRYRGKPGSGFYFRESRHGRKLAFTDCWPENARGWLPSIDHPSDRARVAFRILAPAGLTVVANGTQLAAVTSPTTKSEFRFQQDLPIATYLFAVAVAPLEVMEHHSRLFDERKLSVVSLSYPEEHAAAVEGFGPTASVLAALEEVAGPYPFSKLALVQIPTRFGGMENASCIFLDQNCLDARDRLLPLIAHEMAHQWFGDLVGIADWGELWLSEGFATYGTVLVQEKLEGSAALPREMRRKLLLLLSSPVAQGRAIRDQPVTNPERELNALNYDKGAFVLHMLRRKLGDDVFFRTLKEYVATHALGVCTTKDFRAVAERVSGKDLRRFFDQWIDRAGYPDLLIEQHVEERSSPVLVVKIEQRQPEPFELELEATLTEGESVRREVRLATHLHAASFEFPLAASLRSVSFNDAAWLLAQIEVK